jgi:predicted nucleic-acid-binding Zn-ribbon protein
MLAKGLLDSAGIECQLVDETMGRLLIAGVVGGVTIQVRRTDEEAAGALLGRSATEMDLSSEVERHFRCPQCESRDLTAHEVRKPVTASDSWLQGWVRSAKVWECKSCGYQWED